MKNGLKTKAREFALLIIFFFRPFRAKGGELQSVLDRDEIPEEEDVIRFLRQVWISFPSSIRYSPFGSESIMPINVSYILNQVLN